MNEKNWPEQAKTVLIETWWNVKNMPVQFIMTD